jgi:hypothetical protein
MSATIVTPTRGRGAFPSSGLGGTLNASGTALGAYYRAPAVGSVNMIGLTAARAERDGTSVSVNDYATYMAVRWYQKFFSATVDGIWGPKTDQLVKAWQSKNGLVADGVLGPKTSRAILVPLANAESKSVNSAHPELAGLVRGHVSWESNWDIGAVGGSTPQDLGLGQINGPSHPDMTIQDRLTPEKALAWVANFVNFNLKAFSYNVRDAVAAYNLGTGGAYSWIRSGRPDVWVNSSGRSIEVKKYIDNVLSGQ